MSQLWEEREDGREEGGKVGKKKRRVESKSSQESLDNWIKHQEIFFPVTILA